MDSNSQEEKFVQAERGPLGKVVEKVRTWVFE